MLIVFKKCNMSANNYMREKKKKKKKNSVRPCFKLPTPVLFLVIQEKKNKQTKKNVPMPGPRRVITFFCFFFNSKSSVFSVCQRLQGNMVKKVTLQWLTSPENCGTHLVIPT